MIDIRTIVLAGVVLVAGSILADRRVSQLGRLPRLPRPRPIRRRSSARLEGVQAVRPDEAVADDARLDRAINGLHRANPEMSSATVLSRGQRTVSVLGGACIVAGLFVDTNVTLIAITATITGLYVASLAFRLKLIRLSLSSAPSIVVTDEDARAIEDDDLPTYTVLVPAFKEPTVVETLVASVGKLDYPADRLQVILLLEADDTETVNAALGSVGADQIEIILVPPSHPRTKPKALNYGLQFATGELLTIFDVEDRPEPLQLRRAALALQRATPTTACIQAQLGYHNPTQNLITRWFTVEYLVWFTQMLPGLAHLDAPVPLGGTSNHFRREVLDLLGGWDPFNVTEDADLGVRLHRLGYRTDVLASLTLEEANSDFVNWMKQRSRWYKGYLQTWLVHMRRPNRLRSELGWKGFMRFNTFVGGTPVLVVLNPLFWAMTLVWFIGHPAMIKSIFPAPVYYLGLACWIIGNFLCVYSTLLCTVESDRDDLFVAALLSPLYWVMMSVAATKAFVQLVFEPSYWEKTTHGLDSAPGRQAGFETAASPS